MSSLRSMWLLARRYLAARRFATLVSMFAIALSLVFVVGVGVVNFAVKKSAVEGAIRYPLIVGPSGSSGVQLILSTVFHIDKPAGTIPFSVFEELCKNERVIAAYPMAMADTYANLRMIGTNAAFLKDLGVGVSQGSLALAKVEDAVFGAAAAKRTEVSIGDTFHGQHGMVGTEDAHEHAEVTYRVAGILNTTGGPEDNAIYTSYEAVWKMHAHHDEGEAEGAHAESKDAHEHGAEARDHDAQVVTTKADAHEHGAAEHIEHIGDHHPEATATTKPEAHKHDADLDEHGAHDSDHDGTTATPAEHHHHHHHDKYALSSGLLTAVLVRTANPAYTGTLEREYSLRDGTVAVDTGRSMREFVGHLNKGEVVVEWVSAGMLSIAFVLILVTLLMSLAARRKELALLRMLGVSRLTLSLTIMIEALVLTAGGAALGLVLGHAGAYAAQGAIQKALGVAIEPFTVTRLEMVGFAITLVAGQLLALSALVVTYRMNVVEESAKD